MKTEISHLTRNSSKPYLKIFKVSFKLNGWGNYYFLKEKKKILKFCLLASILKNISYIQIDITETLYQLRLPMKLADKKN